MTSYNQGYPHTPHSITFIWRYNYSVLHSLLYNKGEVTRGREEGIVQRKMTRRKADGTSSLSTRQLYNQQGWDTRYLFAQRSASRAIPRSFLCQVGWCVGVGGYTYGAHYGACRTC